MKIEKFKVENVTIKTIPEYRKDLKKMQKKYRHIKEDVKRAILAIITSKHKPLEGSVRIDHLGDEVKIPVFKLRHFRSTDLKGKGSRSGIRLIYSYEIEKKEITLFEIYYHKSKHSDCNRELIKEYFRTSQT